MYGVYGALLRLAWAAVLPYQFVIALVTGGSGPRLREQLGLSCPLGTRSGGLWVHAVSVGEVRLALPLIARLQERFPNLPIHLTTGTSTGRRLAEAKAVDGGPAGRFSVSQFPFDLPGPMSRLLARLRPRAVLIMETEIWPNLLRLSGEAGVPAVLINGRISNRTYPRYRLVRRFLRRALRHIRAFGMQSEEDARRVRDLGAPPERVRVTGNLKFDLPVPSADAATVRRQLGLPPGTVLFVAGSTAPGEEEPVLEAFRALRAVAPGARLLLAPRHPERFRRAGEALRAAGLRVTSYSTLTESVPERAPDTAPSGTGFVEYDALLVDAVGVLPTLYAAADLVFVGGSLVPRGGHNILEPAALGKPVLFGPHMENFREAAQALTAAGAGLVARDGRELGALAVRLLLDAPARKVASEAARLVVERNRGALEGTVRMISEAAGLQPGSDATGGSRP
jgi:3-deoxy-D-manno-octulosonic-acid transferase